MIYIEYLKVGKSLNIFVFVAIIVISDYVTKITDANCYVCNIRSLTVTARGHSTNTKLIHSISYSISFFTTAEMAFSIFLHPH